MNKNVSFCIKNSEGLVSLIRILTIKPDGSCYIDYENKNNKYHYSLHPPDKDHINGQMHIKKGQKIVHKRKIPKFHDFNENRVFESVLILESELGNSGKQIPEYVNVLEIPKNHTAHIMFIRSNKVHGQIKSAFISNRLAAQSDESNIPYTVFCGVENMPDANYYLAHNIQPMDNYLSDYIHNIKMQYIKTSEIINEKENIFHLRHPFLDTDIEIRIKKEDLEKYEVINNEDCAAMI